MAVTTGEREKQRKVEPKSEQRWFERWQGITGAALGAVATVVGATLPFVLHTHSSAPFPSTPMCLNAGNPLHSKVDAVTIGTCGADNSSQQWAIDGNRIILNATIGTSTPMCLDAGDPPRGNGKPVTISRCKTDDSNQDWAIEGNRIILNVTIDDTPMCLDAGWPPRLDKNRVTIYKCEPNNSDQEWASNGGQVGQVKVSDTLS